MAQRPEKLVAYVATIGYIFLLFYIGEVFAEELVVEESPIEPLDAQTKHLIRSRVEAGIIEDSIMREIALAAHRGDVEKYKQLIEYAKFGFKT